MKIVDVFSGLLTYKCKKEDSGFMTTIVMFWILTLSIGIQSNHGEHITAGLGIGPMEVSFTLHRWINWIP